MPQSIPPGLTRDHVLRAVADLDGDTSHPFGAPTGYELVHGDKRYAPKAVVGLACRYHLSRVLKPDEFSGGEAPGQANFVLRKLGFTVVRKGEEVAVEETPGTDWSAREVGLVVADYFGMLEEEMLGGALNKAEHSRAWPRNSARGRRGRSSSNTLTSRRCWPGWGCPTSRGTSRAATTRGCSRRRSRR